MNWRSFGAGFAVASVLLSVLWAASGGRYAIATPARGMPLRVDRLTGQTYVLQRDEDANGSEVGLARWHKIPDANDPGLPQ